MLKCDEAKPVCKKCSIHFSNIKACDYGPAAGVDIPSISRRVMSRSPLKSHVPARSRSRGIPDPTKVTGATVSAEVSEKLRSISSYQCSTLDGRIDPFSALPLESSPRVRFLMHHCNTHQLLSVFQKLTAYRGEYTCPRPYKGNPHQPLSIPTLTSAKIHSQYCTNPIWLSAAIANPPLFSITLFSCAIHEAGLRGQRESPESIFYKAETVRFLNECLNDPALALADETLAAVLLLTHIVVCSAFQRMYFNYGC
jgi:hypothetical protein